MPTEAGVPLVEYYVDKLGVAERFVPGKSTLLGTSFARSYRGHAAVEIPESDPVSRETGTRDRPEEAP